MVFFFKKKQVWTAGQVIGLIHDIPTCEELVKRIEKEAEDTLKKTSSLIIGDEKTATTTGTVGRNTNNPAAEIWGVGGKSKL